MKIHKIILISVNGIIITISYFYDIVSFLKYIDYSSINSMFKPKERTSLIITLKDSGMPQLKF